MTTRIALSLMICGVSFVVMPVAVAEKVPVQHAPPRFTTHSIQVEVIRAGKFQGTLQIRNLEGNEIKLWNFKSGYGEWAYRIEFLNPKTKRHYVVSRGGEQMSRNFNLSVPKSLKKGEKYEVWFDCLDGTWILPAGLPEDPAGYLVRGWYKPIKFDGEEYSAGKSGVTLDTFVGDWSAWKA